MSEKYFARGYERNGFKKLLKILKFWTSYLYTIP